MPVRATVATSLFSLVAAVSVACSTFGTAAVDAGPAPSPEASAPPPRDATVGPDDARAADAPADAAVDGPLDAGPAPKRAFVTQGLVGMPQAGASAFDAICAAEAGVSSAWMAWVSFGNLGAAQRFRDGGMAGPWVLTTPGAPVVTTANELLSASASPTLRIPISASFGGAPVAAHVWTGVAATGASSNNCSDWTTTEGDKGVVGLSTASDAQWTEATGLQCDGRAHIYCFEK